MKTPSVISLNIQKVYKTDWFVTDSEIKELREGYVFQNQPIGQGDLYGGLYIGIKVEHFDEYLKGSKRYHAVAVCETVMQKIKGKQQGKILNSGFL